MTLSTHSAIPQENRDMIAELSSVPGTIAVMFQALETVNEYGKTGATIGIFDKKTDALSAAEEKGFFGSNGDVREVAVVRFPDDMVFVLESMTPYTANVGVKEDREAKRAAALAKLTPAERAALGV